MRYRSVITDGGPHLSMVKLAERRIRVGWLYGHPREVVRRLKADHQIQVIAKGANRAVHSIDCSCKYGENLEPGESL
jgi:hypothetical protein